MESSGLDSKFKWCEDRAGEMLLKGIFLIQLSATPYCACRNNNFPLPCRPVAATKETEELWKDISADRQNRKEDHERPVWQVCLAANQT